MAASNELLRHVTDGSELRVLAAADKIESSKLMLRLIESERDRQREMLERIPKINTEDVGEDIRCRIGVIKALTAVLNLPQAAKERISTTKE